MHVDAVEIGDELGERVEPLFQPAPVVAGGPVVAQGAQPVDGDALAPVGNGGGFGPARPRQPLPEVVEGGVGHVDPERLHGHRTYASAAAEPGDPDLLVRAAGGG